MTTTHQLQIIQEPLLKMLGEWAADLQRYAQNPNANQQYIDINQKRWNEVEKFVVNVSHIIEQQDKYILERQQKENYDITPHEYVNMGEFLQRIIGNNTVYNRLKQNYISKETKRILSTELLKQERPDLF